MVRDVVSPFTNVVSPSLPETFVGRRGELAEIRTAFENGAKGIVIVGPAGSGKTALAWMFAHQNSNLFPGGIYRSSANWAETPADLLFRQMPKQLTSESLLIIDDVDVFEQAEFSELQRAVQKQPRLRILLTSRRRVYGPDKLRTIHIKGLNREDFDHVIQRLNASGDMLGHNSMDRQIIDRLHQIGNGSPVFAVLAATAVGQGYVGSWGELFNYLRAFRAPGLIGPDGQPLSSNAPEYQRVVVDISSTNHEIIKIVKQNPELIWKLPARKFEEIVGGILERQGYEVELTPASGDGGFDIYAARREGLGQFLYLVECKRYVPPNKVGVEIVRSLYGVLQTKRATAGAIVTTSFFTSGAEEFRREVQHQLHLHDYIALQKWIVDFPLEKT